MTTMPTSVRPSTDLLFLLSQAGHVLKTEQTARLAGLGIAPRGYCVLVNALGCERTQKELAEICSLDKTTMVVTLDELEEAGLARRRPSPSDRRARIVTVTEAGERKIAEAEAIVSRIQDDVLAALPDDERGVFVSALKRLVGERLANPVPCERPVRRRGP
jgi:MarR family transcriptional regulator for hemolysin